MRLQTTHPYLKYIKRGQRYDSTQLNSTQLNSTQLNSTHAEYVDQRFFVKPFYKGFLAFFAGNLFFNAIFFASAKVVA